MPSRVRRPGRRRRALVYGVIAVLLGFLLGWLVRVWIAPAPESRGRGVFEELRERARESTRSREQ